MVVDVYVSRVFYAPSKNSVLKFREKEIYCFFLKHETLEIFILIYERVLQIL